MDFTKKPNKVAEELVGKEIVVQGNTYGIVETEAYLEGNCLTGKEFVHEAIRRLDKEVSSLEKKD